jgi:hypothetical protein
MTELEWQNTAEPERMLDFLKDKASGRKFRLFACACVREVGHFLADPRSRKAYFVAERLVEGVASDAERYAASFGAEWAWKEARGPAKLAAAMNAARLLIGSVRCMRSGWEVARSVAEAVQGAGYGGLKEWQDEVRPQQCDLVREVFGNPFDPRAFDPAWAQRNDGSVRKLATAIYEEKSFEDLPILADALIDAGCEDAAILAHCRSAGDHGRGCWVVDGVLGKT